MYVSAVTKVATRITITVINRGHDNFYVTFAGVEVTLFRTSQETITLGRD